MLNKIRNSVQHNKYVGIVLVVVTIAFVFWGMGLQGGSFGSTYALKVGNLEVKPQEYFRAYQQAKQQIVQQFGNQELSDEILDLFGLEQNVNDQFISQKVLELYANQENFYISEESILDLIKQDPTFQNEDGSFNKDKYIAILASAQLSPIEFERGLQSRIKANLIATIFADSVEVTDFELEKQVAYNQERRDIEVLTIKETDLKPVPEATTEELAKIYNNSIDEYKVPEKRSFKLLTVSKNSLTKNIEVSDEEVKNYYKDNREEFFSKKEYKVSQILVKDEKTANEVLAIADLKDNFGKYVEKYSKDEDSKKSGGDMGWLTSDIFGADFENAMNTTSKGNVATQAVKTLFGYHIFKVEDIKLSEKKSFDEVKDKIKANLVAEKAETALDDTINQALDMVAAGEKLDRIAKALNVTVKTFDDIEATSQLPYANTVFTTGINEVSQPIELSFDSIAFVEVTDIKYETVLALEEVKDIVVAKYNQTKIADMLTEKADEVLTAITENNLSFTQAAKQFKLNTAVQSVVGVARTNNQKKQIENNVAQAVFENDLNTVIDRTIKTSKGIVIVKNLGSFQEEISDKNKENIRTNLKNQKIDNMFMLFSEELKHHNPVKINKQVIKAIKQQ